MNPRQKKKFTESFIEIIRKTSAELPDDVVERLLEGLKQEEKNSQSEYALSVIRQNIELAKKKSQPLCQDTGSILFFIHYPQRVETDELKKLIQNAVVTATKKGYLRQNSVDSLTGKNSGTNIGPGSPSVHLDPWKKDFFDIRLILKGGGCENVGIQYSLPNTQLGADRDLEGVRKCILDGVHKAQGKGCGPGILGVCIGGDRATGYLHSKEQFLRKLGDQNKNHDLATLEEKCLKEANELGIGPMGFGGKTTLLGVKVGVLNRLPASFFVSISYMCWAYRRQGVKMSLKGEIQQWFY